MVGWVTDGWMVGWFTSTELPLRLCSKNKTKSLTKKIAGGGKKARKRD